jgi:hypothetical protein
MFEIFDQLKRLAPKVISAARSGAEISRAVGEVCDKVRSVAEDVSGGAVPMMRLVKNPRTGVYEEERGR